MLLCQTRNYTARSTYCCNCRGIAFGVSRRAVLQQHFEWCQLSLRAGHAGHKSLNCLEDSETYICRHFISREKYLLIYIYIYVYLYTYTKT